LIIIFEKYIRLWRFQIHKRIFKILSASLSSKCFKKIATTRMILKLIKLHLYRMKGLRCNKTDQLLTLDSRMNLFNNMKQRTKENTIQIYKVKIQWYQHLTLKSIWQMLILKKLWSISSIKVLARNEEAIAGMKCRRKQHLGNKLWKIV